jgi:beta-xylosidase
VTIRHFLRRIAVAAAGLLCVGATVEPSFVPLFKVNFPDAFVLPHGSEFIAYSTNDGPNVPVAISRDLVHWSFVADRVRPGKRLDALPKLGSWAKPGFTWAPEVLELRGRYLLYYTASDVRKDSQCIGVAVASDPLGPFVDDHPEPIVCQTNLGGSIDPDAFRDADGKLYLYFKNDGNRVHERTSLWGEPLASDGLSVTGRPVELLKDNQLWEDRVVEAPTMIRSPLGYELFFSGGFFGWNPQEGGLSPYAIGYASCAGPLGPCIAAAENPILHSFHDRSAGCLSGPGHQSVFMVGTRSFMSFHAWETDDSCLKREDRRYLYIAPIFWRDGKPQIGPSLREQTGANRG